MEEGYATYIYSRGILLFFDSLHLISLTSRNITTYITTLLTVIY